MARTWLMLLLSLLCSTGGNVVLKGTMLEILETAPELGGSALAHRLMFTPGLWAGLMLYGMGFLLWIRVLAVAKVSRVYPVAASLSFILILAASSGLFGEHYSWRNMLGVVLIAVGVVLCGMENGRPCQEIEG